MAKRLTKRQRKALRGPNHAVRQSLKHGDRQLVDGTEYRGAVPQHNNAYWVNASRGIPFVRV